MNEELFRQLVNLGVYQRPALEIARRFPDDDMTCAVLTAYKAHVRETDSIPIAVWRLQNGILLTGGGTIDNVLREPSQTYPGPPAPLGPADEGEPPCN